MDSRMMNQLRESIEAAYLRIKPYVLKTPLVRSHYLSGIAQVYFKLENEQLTGALKIRGAFNKFLTLKDRDPESLSNGIIAASSGNHGLGCLEAAKVFGCPVELFVREGISKSKREMLLKRGANLTTYGKVCVEAEIQARRTAQEQCKTYVSPYNDWDVIAGQGTIGLEIYTEMSDLDSVLVSVGGGGVISGVASYLKSRNPNIKIIGCQASNSKVMYECVRARKIVHEESLDTLSEATSGDVEDETITFPLCRELVDTWVLLGEKEIEDALYFMVDKEHKLVEGAAALVVAAYLKIAHELKGQKIVLLICGANIDTVDLKRVLANHSSA